MAEIGPGGGNALINLGELSRPATVLIEKISDAVGGIAKPWQLQRVARAEARAEIIRAQTRVEKSEIEQRALVRMVREEGEKQENIEQITAKAIPLLSPEALSEKVEGDWIAHFFDRSRLTSDDDMQTLWSRILAGEANNPGSYSKRTIDLLATFDKRDAELFEKLCTFIWFGEVIHPLIPDIEHDEMKKKGLTFSVITHLDNIGLVNFNNVTGFQRRNIPKVATMAYFEKTVKVEFANDSENSMNIGKALLTQAGCKLAQICNPTSSEEYFLYILTQWLDAGLILSTPVKWVDE